MNIPDNILEKLLAGQKEIIDRIFNIENAISLSREKEAYTVEEVAERTNRSVFTVRQWCNKGNIHATKVHGRGRQGEWRVSREELSRVEAEGPSKDRSFDNEGRLGCRMTN